MKIRKTVDFRDVHDALGPLYNLLGMGSQNVYCEPGITIGPDKITFVVPASLGGYEGGRRAPGVRKPTEFPHPQEGEENAELSHVVTVAITGFPHEAGSHQAANCQIAQLTERIVSLQDQLAAISAQRPITVNESISAEATAREVARLLGMNGGAL